MAALKGVKTLDMSGGEITKVSYEGAEYEKTDSPVEAGDLFLLKKGHFVIGGAAGAFYSTKKHEEGGIVIPTASIGNASYTQSIGKGVAFRKKYTRLKVGDYAKVVEDDGRWNVSKGDLVKVSDDDKSIRPFHCDILRGAFGGHLTWLRESELVLAAEDEVAAAKEAEEKRSIEAKWAEIGRKVDEYKVGDIVAYDDPYWFENKGFGEVIDGTDSDGDTFVEAVDHRGDLDCNYLAPEKLTLITPVEARFDRI